MDISDISLRGIWQQAAQKMVVVQTNGGSRGDTIYFRMNAGSVAGTCLTDVLRGSAIALQTDQGNWYLLSEEQTVLQPQNFVKNIEYRKTQLNKPKVSSPGLLFFLDTNWLTVIPGTNKEVLAVIFKYYLGNKKVIYTMLPDSRIYSNYYILGEAQGPPADQNVIEVLNSMGVKIQGVNILSQKLQINSLFFVPLLSPNPPFLSGDEISILKNIARKYGLIIVGEWNSWLPYDNFILSSFGVGDRISVNKAEVCYTWLPTKNNQLAKKMPAGQIGTDATGIFSGARDKEIVATTTSGEATMILIDPKDIK